MSLTQKRKIWYNNAVSRRFGKYSFEIFLEGRNVVVPLYDGTTEKNLDGMGLSVVKL